MRDKQFPKGSNPTFAFPRGKRSVWRLRKRCKYSRTCVDITGLKDQFFTQKKKNNLQTPYTGCPRRKGHNFGRVFLRSNYNDITQNTYIQSSMVTQILAREV